MKENWERSRPVQLLEMQELEWMLQSFMPGKKLEAFYLLGGGYSNTNYKLQVKTLGDPLVLRVSSEKLCKFENSLHSRLQQNLPVPEIYFSESHGDRSFSFMEWRTGSQLKEVMKIEFILLVNRMGKGYYLLLCELHDRGLDDV